ncbi:MAG: hypothetical protein ACK4JF_09170, partial [Methylohalobius sp.]
GEVLLRLAGEADDEGRPQDEVRDRGPQLLDESDRPVAVDPDPVLEKVARQRNWTILSLRRGLKPVRLDGPPWPLS